MTNIADTVLSLATKDKCCGEMDFILFSDLDTHSQLETAAEIAQKGAKKMAFVGKYQRLSCLQTNHRP